MVESYDAYQYHFLKSVVNTSHTVGADRVTTITRGRSKSEEMVMRLQPSKILSSFVQSQCSYRKNTTYLYIIPSARNLALMDGYLLTI